jgi:hypothetical protein
MNVVLRASRSQGSWHSLLVTSVIVAAKRLDQRQDTLAAVELTLTQDELRGTRMRSKLFPVSIQGGCCRSIAPTVWSQLIAGCVLAR